MNITETGALIEKSISDLNVDPILCRGEKEGQWNLKYKGATVWIDVFNFPDKPEKYYIQIMSPVVECVHLNKEEFYRDILELNYKMYGTAMCKKDNWIYVLFLRETDNLEQTEIDAALDRVAFYSSDHYSKLSFKYEKSYIKNTQGGNPN